MKPSHLLQSGLNRRNLLQSAGLFAALAAMPLSAARALVAARFPLIQAQFDEYVASRKLAGLAGAIGLGTAAPEYVFAGSLALDNPKPVDANSLWRMYSMTKPVTGMAAMLLISEGKLGLDQPIADFIPEFASMKVLTSPDTSLDSVPAKTQITVRHLLTHTAGLGYNIVAKGPLLEEYNRLGLNPAAVSKKPLPGFPVPAPTPPIDEFARALASVPLVAEPGTRWSYSVALDLLGYVIQLASGVEFGAFLQSRLFDPLGMSSSFFTVPADRLADLTTNYAPLGSFLFPIDPAADSVFASPPAFPFGGAGLICSLADYDRFLAALIGKGTLSGITVFPPEAVALGTSNLLPEGTDTKGTYVDGQGFGAGGRVGLGDRAGSYGWSGAAGTIGFIDSVRGFRATGLAQYIPSEKYPFPGDFIRLVYQELAN